MIHQQSNQYPHLLITVRHSLTQQLTSMTTLRTVRCQVKVRARNHQKHLKTNQQSQSPRDLRSNRQCHRMDKRPDLFLTTWDLMENLLVLPWVLMESLLDLQLDQMESQWVLLWDQMVNPWDLPWDLMVNRWVL